MDTIALLSQPVEQVARQLIGYQLFINDCGGTIVETEAYRETEAAFHSHRREQRLSVLRSQPGTIYIYHLYGHMLVNIVTEEVGVGAGVLLRAIEPTHGIATMYQRSSPSLSRHLLASGPGRLTKALGFEQSWHGQPIDATSITINPYVSLPTIASGRIGIAQGADIPWRFSAINNRSVSRPYPW